MRCGGACDSAFGVPLCDSVACLTLTYDICRRGYKGVILGITGDADEHTLQEFTSAGANGCLVKVPLFDVASFFMSCRSCLTYCFFLSLPSLKCFDGSRCQETHWWPA